MSAYDSIEIGSADGWDERHDGGGMFLAGEHLGDLDESLDDLLGDASCNLGSLEGVSGRTKKQPWMARTVIGAGIKKEPPKVNFPVPPAVRAKVEQVIRGGFVGGAIGKTGKKVQAIYLKRAKLFKKLSSMADKTADPELAADYRNKANKAVANMIRDKLRIERLRFVSVIKAHQVVKSVESDWHVKQAAGTKDPMKRAKHLAAAKAAGILRDKQKLAAKLLLEQKIAFPEATPFVESLERKRTAAEFGPEAACREQRRQEALDKVTREKGSVAFTPPNVTAMYNHFASVDTDGLGWSVPGWKSIKKGAKWIGSKSGDLKEVANTVGKISAAAGPFVAMVPIPPVAQIAGGAMIAGGAGLLAVSKGAAIAEGISKSIFGKGGKGGKGKLDKEQKAAIDRLQKLSPDAAALLTEYLTSEKKQFDSKNAFAKKYGKMAGVYAGGLLDALRAKSDPKNLIPKYIENLLSVAKTGIDPEKARQEAELARRRALAEKKGSAKEEEEKKSSGILLKAGIGVAVLAAASGVALALRRPRA